MIIGPAGFMHAPKQIREPTREEILMDCVAEYGYKWPKLLTSGVMFYMGERITKNEFKAMARSIP